VIQGHLDAEREFAAELQDLPGHALLGSKTGASSLPLHLTASM
jgi:hypothetical protein